MWKKSLSLLAAALAAGCATNERVASLDSRLAQVEASIQFQSRLVKLETQAKLDSSVVVHWHEQVNDARVIAMERREDRLRLAIAALERKLAAAEKPDWKPVVAESAPAEAAPSAKDAWYGQWGWSFSWNKWNRDLGTQLFELYAKGDAKGSIFKAKDPDDRSYMPRDPGKTGQGYEGSAELVGKELTRTRFLKFGGSTLDIATYRGKKNVVIVILRGFDPQQGVCIACSGQTLALSQNLDEFEKKNAIVFLVYPGAADTIQKFLDATTDLSGTNAQIPLEVLMDVDLSVVNEFRIQGKLAKPTTLIVDKQGVVRFAHVGQNKTDRPTVPVLLHALDEIGN